MSEFRKLTDSVFSRFVKGDADALGEFMDAVRELTLNFFLLRDHGFQEIENAIQDIAVKMLQRTPRWTAKRGVAISYWLMCIRNQLILNHQRKGNRGRKVKRFSELDNQQHRRGFDVAAPRKAEVDDFAGKDTVAAAVETLTDKQKEIVRLRFESGLSVVKTAEVLGLKHKSVVDDQLTYIGKKLRKNPALCELLGVDPPSETVRSKPSHVLPNELSEKQWAVVRLVHDQGKSYREAAQLLGWTRDAVRGAWRSARARIAKSEKLQALTGIVPDSKA